MWHWLIRRLAGAVAEELRGRSEPEPTSDYPRFPNFPPDKASEQEMIPRVPPIRSDPKLVNYLEQGGPKIKPKIPFEEAIKPTPPTEWSPSRGMRSFGLAPPAPPKPTGPNPFTTKIRSC